MSKWKLHKAKTDLLSERWSGWRYFWIQDEGEDSPSVREVYQNSTLTINYSEGEVSPMPNIKVLKELIAMLEDDATFTEAEINQWNKSRGGK